jgi:type I restriction enzyme, S subunit
MITNLFFKNFTTFAGAPGCIIQLRELILHLALSGKLVRQNHNEKPVEISLDLESNVGEFITKRRGHSPIKDLSISSKLPSGWRWHRLANFVEFSYGFPFESTKFNEINQGIPLIRIRDLKKNYTKTYYDGDFDKSYLISKGNILIGMDGDFNIVKWDGELALLNQRICKLKFKTTNLFPDYAFYAMIELLKQIQGQTSHVTVKHLSAKQLNSIFIPIPPLAEQHRIVAKVDRLMALCDELEAKQQQEKAGCLKLGTASLVGLQNAESSEEFERQWAQVCDAFDLILDCPENVAVLRKTILQLAVQGRLVRQDPGDEPAGKLVERIRKEISLSSLGGRKKFAFELAEKEGLNKPFSLPSNWKWISLGTICELITKGSSPKWQGVHYADENEGILFITSKNVDNFKLKLSNKQFVESKFNEIEPRSILKRNDLLMNLVGASIGRTAIFESDEIANINQAVCLIRIFEGDKFVNFRYFLLFFNSPICISYMFDNQVESARANLSMTNVAKFQIPLPPLAEQHRIVAKVDALMALCDTLESRLKERAGVHTRYAGSIVKNIAGSVQ